ncbi:MAG: ABC transporter ATP-binding protein [Candidatus Micrarchaeota archaeon]|nr:ABC transporter ATP-binding protein [Candidatus Micrarchaeota archaeon]
MKNVTWEWFFGIFLLIMAISILSLFIIYLIYLSDGIFVLGGIIENGGIFWGFVYELIVMFVLGIVALRIAYFLFKKENNIELKRYFSFEHFHQIYKNLPRFRDSVPVEDEIRYCENWRLSYYKAIPLFFLTILSFAIVWIIPIIYSYYPNLYHQTPLIFLILDLLYGIFFFAGTVSFMFIGFYLFSRLYYSLSTEKMLSIFITEGIEAGKTFRREKTEFIPIPKRNKIQIDLWLTKLFIRSLKLNGLTIEEKFGVREFVNNLATFDRFIRSANGEDFNKFSKVFDETQIALTNLSQPQLFLNNYHKLKETYQNLREGHTKEFDTNKLYDINKGFTLNRMGREFRTLRLTNIITIAFIILVLILFILQVFVYHSLQIPSFPTL